MLVLGLLSIFQGLLVASTLVALYSDCCLQGDHCYAGADSYVAVAAAVIWGVTGMVLCILTSLATRQVTTKSVENEAAHSHADQPDNKLDD